MTRTEELLALAAAATPGQWAANTSDEDEPIVYVDNQYICQTIYDHQSYTYRENPAGHLHDARFIAAANPETIRQLVELVRLQHFLILGYAGYNTREEIRRQSVIEAFNKWEGK